MIYQHLCILILCCAMGASALESALEEIRHRFTEEYRACTGDSTTVAFDSILSWKRALNRWVESVDYPTIVQEYQRNVAPSELPSTCGVRSWYEANRPRREVDTIVVLDTLHAKRRRFLSNEAALDLSLCTRSGYDFDSIPFGISKATLRELVATRTHEPILHHEKRVIAQSVQFAGVLVSVAFHLDENNRYYKYELESMALPADSLDEVVRPCAKVMGSHFESILGKPTRVARIGLFDIVQGRLSPYMQWDTDHYGAYVGLATDNYRYYAKALVLRKRQR